MDQTDKKLSIDQAYDVVVDYLDKYYKKTKLDELGDLVGDMMLLDDNISLDPAAIDDWKDSVEKILSQHHSEVSNQELTPTGAYAAMIDYLKEYGKRINSEEINSLVHAWMLSDDNKIVNRMAWQEWMSSMSKVLQEFPEIRPRFTLMK